MSRTGTDKERGANTQISRLFYCSYCITRLTTVFLALPNIALSPAIVLYPGIRICYMNLIASVA